MGGHSLTVPCALGRAGLPRETHIVPRRAHIPDLGQEIGAVWAQAGGEESVTSVTTALHPYFLSLLLPPFSVALCPFVSICLFLHVVPAPLALFCHTIAAPFPVTCSSSCQCRRAGHHDNRDRPRF